MFHRINQKIYGIACLFIVLSLLTFGGIAIFLDRQTEAAEKEQAALVSASDFFTLRQMFFQLRAWDRAVLLKGDPEAESRFVQTMQLLKEQLTQYHGQATQQQRRTQIGAVSGSVRQYENDFSQLSQLIARHQLLETDIETTYKSIEAAGLNRGDSLLLRKVFLLNHFQVGYIKDGRSSGFQALKIVLESMAQAFEEAGSLDNRIIGYVVNYGHLLDSYEALNKDIEETSNSLEKNYLLSVNFFEKLSNDLETQSNRTITSSNERRIQLKKVMYIYFPLVSVIMFAFLLMLAKKIVTPINSLLQVINEVKAGNSAQRFQSMGGSEDELNQLGLSFNSMLDRLDDHQTRMLEYQAELTNKVTELGETNEKLQVEITERMLADKEKTHLEEQLRQSQKMEALGTLAGGIAHDFNNILAAILGYTELTRLRLADRPKEKKSLDEVLKAANRGKQLIQQILVFSRKGEGKRDHIKSDLVVEEAISLLRQTIPATIPIHVSLDSQTGTIQADPTQIHQIVINLCTNAYHAVRDVSGEIEVRLEPVEVDQQMATQNPDFIPGAYAQLTIKDTGTGIPPSVRPRIFDPFFTTKKQGEGTGMGLAVAYGIIQDHCGAIEVESAVGTGTTFRVFLPLSFGEANKVSATQMSLQYGSERVLFVDDESMLVRLGKMTLETLGYQATATTSANEALEIFSRDPDGYDLIISDQSMPEMSGAQLAKGMQTGQRHLASKHF